MSKVLLINGSPHAAEKEKNGLPAVERTHYTCFADGK